MSNPQLGRSWSFELSGAEPLALALFNLGLSPSDSALGTDGFLLFQPFGDLLQQSLPVDAVGNTSSLIPIPNLIGLTGLSLSC